MDIAPKIISCALTPVTTISDIENLCAEAVKTSFPGICIPPLFVKKAVELTAGTKVKVSTVIGFPFGYSAVEAKLAEVVLAIVDGADEIDVMINMLAVKNNDWQYLAHELNAIMPLVKSKQKILKIIIESGDLTKDEMTKCCDLYGIAGIDYLVTSTGYSVRGTSREDVKHLRNSIADSVKIIAAGHIDACLFAKDLLDEGADFLSTSHAAQLVKDCKKG